MLLERGAGLDGAGILLDIAAQAEGSAMAKQTYRLVTRSDFDGKECAVLLKQLGMIDEIMFVHPKDKKDGTIKITNRDQLAVCGTESISHPIIILAK